MLEFESKHCPKFLSGIQPLLVMCGFKTLRRLSFMYSLSVHLNFSNTLPTLALKHTGMMLLFNLAIYGMNLTFLEKKKISLYFLRAHGSLLTYQSTNNS